LALSDILSSPLGEPGSAVDGGLAVLSDTREELESSATEKRLEEVEVDDEDDSEGLDEWKMLPSFRLVDRTTRRRLGFKNDGGIVKPEDEARETIAALVEEKIN